MNIDKSIKNLRIISKVFFVFAFLIVILKIILQPEYRNVFAYGFTLELVSALIVNVVFNFLLLFSGSVLFNSLADILEKLK